MMRFRPHDFLYHTEAGGTEIGNIKPMKKG